MQFITDGHKKYIYYPANGSEQFFDLDADPEEMVDLSGTPDTKPELEEHRVRLTDELDGRPEGFVKNGRLAPTGGPTPLFLPGFERGA